MEPAKLETVDVDLRRPFTRTEWANAENRFFLAAIPGWFRWLSWVFALSVLRWLADRSGSWITEVLFYLSLALLAAYYEAYFYRFQFLGLPFAGSEKRSRTWSLTLAGVVVAISCSLTIYLALLAGKYK